MPGGKVDRSMGLAGSIGIWGRSGMVGGVSHEAAAGGDAGGRARLLSWPGAGPAIDWASASSRAAAPVPAPELARAAGAAPGNGGDGTRNCAPNSARLALAAATAASEPGDCNGRPR